MCCDCPFKKVDCGGSNDEEGSPVVEVVVVEAVPAPVVLPSVVEVIE